MIDEPAITQRHRLLAGHLSPRELRLWAAAEASAYGHGGIAAMSRATGIAATTIRRAQREFRARQPATDARRASG